MLATTLLLLLAAATSPAAHALVRARPSMAQCSKCGQEQLNNCDGNGRVAWAMFDWMPKAYKPCPQFVETGGIYEKVGTAAWDSYDEVGGQGLGEKTRRYRFEGAGGSGFVVAVDQDQTFYRTRSDGTGALVWGSSFAMAEFVHREGVPVTVKAGAPVNTMPVEGLRVVELGAGLGLVSIALAKRGALVTATDGQPDVLAKLQANAKKNLNAEELARLDTQLLLWGEDDATGGLDPSNVDVLLISDVFYAANRRYWPSLIRTLSALVPASRAGGKLPLVLWTHTSRDDDSTVTSPVFVHEVFRPLRKKFQIMEVDRANLHPAYRKSSTSMFVLTPRAAAAS